MIILVDNGDNDGNIIDDYYDSANNTQGANSCILNWEGNMRCDPQNNQAKCNWDGGDCCLSTCLLVCQQHGYSNVSCPCRQYTLNCLDPNATCANCSKTNAVCLPQSQCLVGPSTDPNYHIIRLVRISQCNYYYSLRYAWLSHGLWATLRPLVSSAASIQHARSFTITQPACTSLVAASRLISVRHCPVATTPW